MDEIEQHLCQVAYADPASLVGRYRTVDTYEEAVRVQAEVRRALRAGRDVGLAVEVRRAVA